jgi:urate oxidase
MAIVLGPNRYGKAELRLLHVSGGEVFYASDRPYGLIEETIHRDDAPPPGKAW